MSYPFQGDLNFEIHTAPAAPATARQLVAEQGIEAVRDALPARERGAFDQANPWRNIERASQRLEERVEELNAFDQDIQQHIANEGYNDTQAQVVYEQTAGVRQPLADAVSEAERS
ncbi:hypothetical protein [Streptomyces sp. NPDC005423]|uniref:hypothetical protein n=1 Tax=Streptomyces sp. NPDC005423 TaxID=3155343 RepID=UPI0033AB29FA